MQVALPAALAPFPEIFRAREAAASVPRAAAAAAPIRTLEAGTALAVSHPRGQRIDCLRGSIWLTFDGEPRDVVLDAGQSHTAEGDTRLLVYGLEAAEFRIA
jgi:hypothetical protein